MGLQGPTLATKINILGLGFNVNNHMTNLTEDEEDALRRALEREARDNMVEERISATVIRRKPKKKIAPAPVVEAAPEVPILIFKPVPKKTEEHVEEPVEQPPVVAVAEPAVAETPPVEVEEQVAEAVEPAEGAPTPSTTPEPLGNVVGEEIKKPGRAEVVAALARQSAEATGRQQKGAAQVVGSLSPELLQARLAVDRKTFGPPMPRNLPGSVPTGTRETFEQEQAGRRKRKRGKKVYGASELYDRRSNRRRAHKKPTGGASTQITEAAQHKRVIKMEEAILVSELAHQLGVKGGEIALKLMMDLGVKGANINTPLDMDTVTLIADSYGWTVERKGFDLKQFLPKIEESEEDYVRRPPVVTVMGHVDHGKTSLLDAIRQSDVAGSEAGGITQHIGAHKVDLPNDRGTVVFLDTPGHEAFTALRARGAQATDIVVLVVAADDGVMPQTVEAINHAKDAGVPIVVAVNKIDKAGANAERVKQALTEYELVPEAWGGETLFAEVSALEGTGIEELLEAIMLQAEVADLTANPNRLAEGIVIEARLDVGRGPVATVLIRQGTLKPGTIVVAGSHWGRVRALFDDKGKQIDEALPATPVEITGLDGVPEAGEALYGLEDEKSARTIAGHIAAQYRQKVLVRSAAAPTDIESLTQLLEAGKLEELKVIVKSDVQGSNEALVMALEKIGTDEVAVRVVHAGVGGITENDVNLAASTGDGAIIIGFNVRPETRGAMAAERLGVMLMTHNVIYDVIDDIKKLLSGLLSPTFDETSLGRAEVREVFMIPKVGAIAGCMVVEGSIIRGSLARVVRDSVVVYESQIATLRRFKDDAKEVKQNFECGLSIQNFNDIKQGDVIETYKITEIQRSL
jgi:translation initiation factor IF-2